MNYKPLIFLGFGLIISSLIGMIYRHEYSINGGCFIIGIIIIGFAYAKGTEPLPAPESGINVNGINKNIGILNGILWGKQEKESAIKLTKEQYWQITTQDKCRDLQDIRGISYCWYGSKRGYCTYERCPRRIK